MLPIAMLPVAGLLLRFGQADLLNIQAVADAGNAIFANLPLLFAIGVAVGFAKDNNGTSGLAGAVGYLILTAMLKSINKDIDTGVLGGIISGSLAGVMYNRYRDIKLPEFLAFFGGKRFVPIITGVLSVLIGVVLGFIWPPIQSGLHIFSTWMSNAGEIGLFLYGFFNRLLLVTGLHHVFNSLFWFQLGDFTNNQGVVVHGDIARFMAGDPTAGYFMAGFFPIMMFGLPAICLAMYTTAYPQNRKAVAGLLLSMALTSFLTGVTEPIEYAFVFLAPVLYLIHAILTGVALAVSYALHIRLGFSFSAGAIDYLLFYKLAQNPLTMLPVGLVMGVVYYILGVFFIKKFNLSTIGRESAEEVAAVELAHHSTDSIELQYISALGGADNLINVDACTTRLRLIVKNPQLADKIKLKALGAKGFVSPAPDSLQVILGPQAEVVASSIRDALNNLGHELLIKTDQHTVLNADLDLNALILALGGKANLKKCSLVALTRIKLELNNPQLLDENKINQLGIILVVTSKTAVKQLYIGNNATEFLTNLNTALATK
jgi:PTS system N-acetylglucosamine-specific IIC component